MKKLLRSLFILFLVLAGITLILLTPVDRRPYQEMEYYAETLQSLDSLKQQVQLSKGDTLQAGWSRRNITPDEPLKLMGYGWKGDYESVHDSLMLRCFVFDNGRQSIALLSYDLMIVHPDLSEAIRYALDTAQLAVDGLYFTATHTHKGYGEWAKGLGGKLTAGGYSPELIEFVAQQTLSAIRQAQEEKQQVKIGYAEIARPELIRNRLTKGAADDNLLRVIKLEQKGGKTALFCTFAAHATFINSGSMQLSADYPGMLVQELERHPEIDFAAFSAGAVGSHSPYREGAFSFEKMQAYAKSLAEPLMPEIDSVETAYTRQMQFVSLPLSLGEPQFKVGMGWRVRPWLFHAFFGDLSPELTGLRLGEVVLMGVPADYSGMLYPVLEPEGKHLIVTSFNGSYIGYVIPNTYYNLPHREAQELNWYGPYTGSYITEVMNRVLGILAKVA